MNEYLLEQFLEPLMASDTYFTKKMFGGLSVYYNGLMVLTLSEKAGDREWRGEKFNFDLWNGVLVCTSREHHESLKIDIPAIINHPVIPKWLYLPMDNNPNFEPLFDSLVELVMNGDTRIGIVPGMKNRKSKKTKKKATKKSKKKVTKAAKKKTVKKGKSKTKQSKKAKKKVKK